MSNNFIGNEGLKFLMQTLGTLKELELLDVSGNLITESGLQLFSNAMKTTQKPSHIRNLKLSFNPISSSSLEFVSALCHAKKIESLSMVSCDLTETTFVEVFNTLKSLDISYNHLSANGFKNLLRKLNSDTITTLNFEKCCSDSNIGEPLVQFITSGSFACLKEFNLAGLNFNENEILDVLRNIEKCEQLKLLNLSHQKQLTFLSLKFILVSMESRCLEQVKLVGCKNLQNLENMFSFQNIDSNRQSSLRNLQLSVPKETAGLALRKNFIEKMKEMWDVVSGCRGKVEHEKNILRLTRSDSNKQENLCQF